MIAGTAAASGSWVDATIAGADWLRRRWLGCSARSADGWYAAASCGSR
ncbi:hypothetical protein [Nannocystis punicea]|uniref:Uncharacterized protein n=1 Tax=Nannocystis punicea TaxID=2995304 RepID=A0ABY7GU43_9BACT|nr:hypothetical protein [Nannocystis poenicansa]WAS90472.1 hypothetical protein O0S08_30150 [Nannocystis poenicansa]